MTNDEYYDSAAKGACPYSDFEWFAVDRVGHLAFLTSAGFGPVPKVVFKSKPEYFMVREMLLALPFRGDFELRELGPQKRIAKDWIEMARRGLFGYDWNPTRTDFALDCHPYEIVAAPKKPLLVSELPSPIKECLVAVRFSSDDFRESVELFPQREFTETNLDSV